MPVNAPATALFFYMNTNIQRTVEIATESKCYNKGKMKEDTKSVPYLPNRDNHEPPSIHKLNPRTPQRPILHNSAFAHEPFNHVECFRSNQESILGYIR